MNKYIIIPGCSDLNRGDQALVWETKKMGESSGFRGEYYLTAEKNEPVEQSKREGIKIIEPIIEHPSRLFKNKQNISYSASLKLKWGVVAVFDFLGSLLYLSYPTRCIARALAARGKKETLKVFENCDAVFIKGGGLLQTYGGITAAYSMYFWCFHIFLASALKKPIYMMPNSLGPFDGPLVKPIAKAALRKCTVVTARESLSAKMVKNDLDIEIPTYPDLAFGLKPSKLDWGEVCSKFNIPNDRNLVAITMRPYRFPKSSDPERAYIRFKAQMAKFIDILYFNGYMPVIVEHTLAVNAHENDGACIKDVVSQVDKGHYCLISNKSYDCHDLKKIYSCCDYIVGTRFHSVIFSLSSGVPGIAICYVGNKAQGIMHDIGLDDYAISIYEVTAERLAKLFENLIMDESNIKKKISRYNDTVNPALAEMMACCTLGKSNIEF